MKASFEYLAGSTGRGHPMSDIREELVGLLYERTSMSRWAVRRTLKGVSPGAYLVGENGSWERLVERQSCGAPSAYEGHRGHSGCFTMWVRESS